VAPNLLADINQRRYGVTVMPRPRSARTASVQRPPLPLTPGRGSLAQRLMAMPMPESDQGGGDSSGVGGVAGTLGKIIGKPLGTFFDAIDTPRAGVNALLTEAFGEAIPRLFPNEPTGLDTDFSWQDIWENTKNNTGFGTSIVEPIMGPEGTDRSLGWRRAAGFFGDLATDPLSYITAGAGQITGKAGRADELFKLMQAQKAAAESGDVARIAALGGDEALVRLGKRGTQTANAAQREAMGLRDPGFYLGGRVNTTAKVRNIPGTGGRLVWDKSRPPVRVPLTGPVPPKILGLPTRKLEGKSLGGTVNQAVGVLREPVRRIPGAAQLRKATTPVGFKGQGLNSAFETVLGRGTMPASKTGMSDIQRALYTLDANTTQRLAGSGFKGAGTTELKRLSRTLRRTRQTPGALAALVRAGEEGGEQAANNPFVRFGHKMRDIAAALGIELPGFQGGNYATPHVLTREFRDFIESEGQQASDAVKAFREKSGITSKDLLEEGGFLQRRRFVVEDGQPTQYYFGPESLRGEARQKYMIELKTGSVDELNSELHRIFPDYKGKIYEDDPIAAWERYINAVSGDVAMRATGKRGLETGAPGFYKNPDLPDNYDPIQWQFDEAGALVGADLGDAAPPETEISQFLKWTQDTEATKARKQKLGALKDVAEEDRAAATAERQAAASELDEASRVIYEPITAERREIGEEIKDLKTLASKYKGWIAESDAELNELNGHIAQGRKQIQALRRKQKRIAETASKETKEAVSAEMARIRQTYDAAVERRKGLVEYRNRLLDEGSDENMRIATAEQDRLQSALTKALQDLSKAERAAKGSDLAEVRRMKSLLKHLDESGAINEYLVLKHRARVSEAEADRLTDQAMEMARKIEDLQAGRADLEVGATSGIGPPELPNQKRSRPKQIEPEVGEGPAMHEGEIPLEPEDVTPQQRSTIDQIKRDRRLRGASSLSMTPDPEAYIPRRWSRQPNGSWWSGDWEISKGPDGRWRVFDDVGIDLGTFRGEPPSYRTLVEAKQAAAEYAEGKAYSVGPGGMRQIRTAGRNIERVDEAVKDLKARIPQVVQQAQDYAETALNAKKKLETRHEFRQLDNLLREAEFAPPKIKRSSEALASARGRVDALSEQLNPPRAAEAAPPAPAFTPDDEAALEVARKALQHPSAVEVVQRQNRLKGGSTAGELRQARIDRKWLDDNPVIARRVKKAQTTLAAADEAPATRPPYVVDEAFDDPIAPEDFSREWWEVSRNTAWERIRVDDEYSDQIDSIPNLSNKDLERLIGETWDLFDQEGKTIMESLGWKNGRPPGSDQLALGSGDTAAREAAQKVLNGPKARQYLEATERLKQLDSTKALRSRGAAADQAWLDANPDAVARVQRAQDRIAELTAKRDNAPKPPSPERPAPIPETFVDPEIRYALEHEAQARQAVVDMPARRAEMTTEGMKDVPTRQARLQPEIDAELTRLGLNREAVATVKETMDHSNGLYEDALANQAAKREELKAFEQSVSDVVGRQQGQRRPRLSESAPSDADIARAARGERDMLEVQPLASALSDLRKLIEVNPGGADPLLNRLEAVLTSGLEGQGDTLAEQLKRIDQGLRHATLLDINARSSQKILDLGKKGKLQPVLKAEINNTYRLLWEGGDILVDRELEAMYRNIIATVEAKGFWKAVEKFTNLFKTYATLTPGFHVRNALSAIFMNGTEGVPLTTQLRGAQLWRQYTKAPDPTAWLAGRSRQEQDAFAAVFASGTGGQFTERGVGQVVAGQGAAIGRALENPATRLSKRWGSGVEGSVRLGLALDSVGQGMDSRATLNRITRLHFDYSQVSEFDETMKRIIPFWTFMSRNVPLQLTQMATKPKWYARLNRLQENAPETDPLTPEYITQMGALDTGLDVPSWLPGAGEGDPIMFSPDLGHLRLGEDFARYTGALTGESKLQALSDVNPLFTVPFEYMSGEDFFTGQRYEPWERKEKAIAAARGLIPLVDRTVRLNPMSESNDPDRLFEAWLKTLTGAPIRTISQKQRESEARSQAYQQREALRRAAMQKAG
jgi:hypothetical protein